MHQVGRPTSHSFRLNLHTFQFLYMFALIRLWPFKALILMSLTRRCSLNHICHTCIRTEHSKIAENGTIQSNECHSEMPQVSASSFSRLQIFLPAWSAMLKWQPSKPICQKDRLLVWDQLLTPISWRISPKGRVTGSQCKAGHPALYGRQTEPQWPV